MTLFLPLLLKFQGSPLSSKLYGYPSFISSRRHPQHTVHLGRLIYIKCITALGMKKKKKKKKVDLVGHFY
jgi:hypothetical protein